MFCDFQIFPATRKEAGRLYFSSQELPTVQCSGDVEIHSACVWVVFAYWILSKYVSFAVCAAKIYWSLKFMNEVLLQNLCESCLGTAIVRRYVEPRSAHAIAYSGEKVPSEKKNCRTPREWKSLVLSEKTTAEHVAGKCWCCRKKMNWTAKHVTGKFWYVEKKEHVAEKVHLPLRKIFVLHQTK